MLYACFAGFCEVCALYCLKDVKYLLPVSYVRLFLFFHISTYAFYRVIYIIEMRVDASAISVLTVLVECLLPWFIVKRFL